MCSGSIFRPINNVVEDVSGARARREARRKQAEADRKARERQAELDRLAREREAAAAQQRAEMQALRRQQAEQQRAQDTKVAGLKAQQAETLAGIDARGRAVTQSLQVLARQRPKQAPTAAQTTRTQTARGAKPRRLDCAWALDAQVQAQAQTSRCNQWNQLNSATAGCRATVITTSIVRGYRLG